MFLPHPRVKVSIVGSLHDREVACSASDRQGTNFESCVWRTVSSQSSHHPQEVLLAQFSLYVHKDGLKPDSFYLISTSKKWNICTILTLQCILYQTNDFSFIHSKPKIIMQWCDKTWRNNHPHITCIACHILSLYRVEKRHKNMLYTETKILIIIILSRASMSNTAIGPALMQHWANATYVAPPLAKCWGIRIFTWETTRFPDKLFCVGLIWLLFLSLVYHLCTHNEHISQTGPLKAAWL